MASLFKNYPPIKVVFVGDASVGKTSIVERLVRDHFSDKTNSTIGAAFIATRYPANDPQARTYHIWDTAGQERYSALVPLYVSGAAVIVLVYDVTQRRSFERIEEYWIPFIRQNLRLHADDAIPMMLLLGNKSDLIEAGRDDTIKSEAAQSLAKEYTMGFQEVSAKTGAGSAEVFAMIAKHADDLVMDQADYVRISRNASSNSSGCAGFRCW